MKKTCNLCNLTKPISEFHKDKSKADGHRYLCKECNIIRSTEWKKKNPEKVSATLGNYIKSGRAKENKRKWNKTAKGKALSARRRATPEYKAWRKEYERSEAVVAYRKAYKTSPKRKAKSRELGKRPHVRERHRLSEAKKRATAKGKLHNAMSCRVRQCIVKGEVSWPDIVGYTPEQLRRHLERQFLKGMTWENYGKFGWHVDHIVPVSSFRFTSASDTEFKACWALGNLRPLWSKENHSKHAKRTHLL